jgi:mannose-6-phosphate isomerase-like protein (cupin superfamily)
MDHLDAPAPPFNDPVQVLGSVEAEARGFAYGAMVFTVEAGRSTEPHAHRSEETWIVREGAGRAAVGDRSVSLTPGTQLIVPADTPHSITSTSAGTLVIIAFWWRDTSDGA